MTERGQRMLRLRVLRGRQLSARSIATDLQTSCGLQIRSRTVQRASWNVFSWPSSCIQARHQHNTQRQMQWRTARCHWTLEQWRCSLERPIALLHLTWWMSLGLVFARRTVLDCTVPSVQFCTAWLQLGSLVPVKGTLNASAHQQMLDSSSSQLCGNSLGMVLPVPTWLHQCTKQLHKDTRREFGVDELDWWAQSPDLNLTEHLWDELERRLRARPSCPTSVCDLSNVLLEERSDRHCDNSNYNNTTVKETNTCEFKFCSKSRHIITAIQLQELPDCCRRQTLFFMQKCHEESVGQTGGQTGRQTGRQTPLQV